jgi:glycosyltransferase involved in cell wall biosynthesis
MRHLRHARPDVVFSAEDHLNVLVVIALILTNSKARMSGSSRVTPFDTYSDRIFSKRWLLKQMARATMWRADVLTCVSKDMVEQYRQVFHNPPHKAVYNIVDNEDARRRMTEPVDIDWLITKDVPVIVAAGQLEKWKGFSDLIAATKLLVDRRPARLILFGEGSLRPQLEAQIDALGLRDCVHLPGNVQNPLKYFTRADVFALSSYVEGMPNALVEAMLCGCTPVATDCRTGPRELLNGGEYGYLAKVGDAGSIADCLQKALDHPIDKAALTEATRPFSEDAVIARHFNLLDLPEAPALV